VPAARDQAAEDRGPPRLVVDVERLRVELARELDDLFARDRLGAQLELVTLADVFEVEDAVTLHGRCGGRARA
jgi:hypothetical protein